MSKRRPWSDYHSFEANGDTWIPPGQAKRELDWDWDQLRKAKEHGCLLSNWKKLKSYTKQIRGRFFEFISRKGIDQIKRAKESLNTDPTDTDEISLEEAARIAGRTRKTLKPLIDGISERRRGLAKNGRICKRYFVSKSRLRERIHARLHTVPADRMTVAEAVEFLGVDMGTVHEWRLNHCPFLGVRTIGFIEGEVPTPQGLKPGILLSRKDVEDVRRAMRRKVDRPFRDSRGKWLPEKMARKKFKKTKRILRYQHSRGRLEVQTIPHYTKKRRTIEVWFYLESSLKRCFARRPAQDHSNSNGSQDATARVSRPNLERVTHLDNEGLGSRTRPARQKHLQWKEWKDSGMSYTKIANQHARETGVKITRDAVIQALRRL